MNIALENERCGFVAILGSPNVGKSTLLNHLTGYKVSIVSPKPQTTRQRILGLVIAEESQIILVDTPGIFSPRKEDDHLMVKAVWKAAREVDLRLIMMDVSRAHHGKSTELLKNYPNAILVLNKIDLIERKQLLALAQEFSQLNNARAVFMISALNGDGTDKLRHYLKENVPLSPWLFPEDTITDLPQRLWAAEITREQLYLQLRQELPYESWVTTTGWETFANGSLLIRQTIHVEKNTHKKIIIGSKGAQIKMISQAARQELMRNLKVNVHLFVKVSVG